MAEADKKAETESASGTDIECMSDNTSVDGEEAGASGGDESNNNNSVDEEAPAVFEDKYPDIKAPDIVDCLQALGMDAKSDLLMQGSVLEAGTFFLNVGLYSMHKALKSTVGLYSWEVLKDEAWEVEMATAATFIEQASSLTNIKNNIQAKKFGKLKKKRDKMITKNNMPGVCAAYCKYRKHFASMRQNPKSMDNMKVWEERCGIYRPKEESSARKRARLGPAPDEMKAAAKKPDWGQHVSNFSAKSALPSMQKNSR